MKKEVKVEDAVLSWRLKVMSVVKVLYYTLKFEVEGWGLKLKLK